jgi:hypothetical protein
MKTAGGVTAALAVLALGMTWPLGARLTSSVPGGYGDPLHAIWAMGWVMRSLSTAVVHPATLRAFWDADIFVPQPQALAFSEPFIGQSLLVLPIYWLGATPLVCYNAAFLASWVLSGLGTFLLVRSLTDGDSTDLSVMRAASVAGIAAAVVMSFNPFRLGSAVNRLDVQSIEWLPFALLAIHRYLVSDARRALLLAALAVVGLNLCSIDRMIYGVAAVVAFTVVEIVRSRRWQLRVWLELWAAAAAVVLVTLVSTLPYLEVQRRFRDVPPTDGLAVLLAMVIALVVGLTAKAIALRWPRHGVTAIAFVLAAYLGALKSAGFPIDRPVASETLAPPPQTLGVSDRAPRIYREVRTLSSDAVLLELPLGDPAYDLRYLFFAATHSRRLINGYGRVIPASYRALQQVLVNPALDPEQTRKAIGLATHIILHRGAWPEAVGTAVARQLTGLGATVLAQEDDAVLFQMQPSERVTERQVP